MAPKKQKTVKTNESRASSSSDTQHHPGPGQSPSQSHEPSELRLMFGECAVVNPGPPRPDDEENVMRVISLAVADPFYQTLCGSKLPEDLVGPEQAGFIFILRMKLSCESGLSDAQQCRIWDMLQQRFNI